MTLYLVKNGIDTAKVIKNRGERLYNTNYYSITYDFTTNEGYIEMKGLNNWRLYTQVGQRLGTSRYHDLQTFEQCVEKLERLSECNKIIVCKSSEIERYKN